MVKKTKGWPPQRRAEQAERLRQRQPWRHSTGPRTVEGKATVSRNAYRHGYRSADYDALCALLKEQAAFVNHVMAQVSQDNARQSLDFSGKGRYADDGTMQMGKWQ